MTSSITDVVQQLWPGRESRVSPIAAGLTNQNFQVEVGGRPFFVRLPGQSTDLLAVDRANELHIWRIGHGAIGSSSSSETPNSVSASSRSA